MSRSESLPTASSPDPLPPTVVPSTVSKPFPQLIAKSPLSDPDMPHFRDDWWYVSTGDGLTYLHSDGVIREGTHHEEKALGWYRTKEEAQAAIDAYEAKSEPNNPPDYNRKPEERSQLLNDSFDKTPATTFKAFERAVDKMREGVRQSNLAKSFTYTAEDDGLRRRLLRFELRGTQVFLVQDTVQVRSSRQDEYRTANQWMRVEPYEISAADIDVPEDAKKTVLIYFRSLITYAEVPVMPPLDCPPIPFTGEVKWPSP